ncbi:Hint domain-containing protein [Halocynthiibacter sp.]|uniref:Hint domain-containing protein n=1 Tax=Halocynthiibacter sp. TaxID=1979210 RepID=UPI003C5D8A0B
MPLSTSDVIFLGNFADADTDETTVSIENTAPYLGVHGSAADPLKNHLLSVTYDDVNSDNNIRTNNFSPNETISYDLDDGNGVITSEVDSLIVANLTVTYMDGSTASFTNTVLYQDTSGNLFLTNSNFAGTNINGTPPQHLRSIDVTSIINSAYSGLFQNALQPIVCFARSTRILTQRGECLIEDLKTGDLVYTRDNGLQPIRWIGSSTRLAAGPLAPVLIRKGALGNNRDLRVSQQHRMLVTGWRAELFFGETEVLVPAKSLLNDKTITLDTEGSVEYFHMMFDTHEIVFAEGAPAESFHPGEEAWSSLDEIARSEILEIFPELARDRANTYGPTVRRCLTGREARTVLR